MDLDVRSLVLDHLDVWWFSYRQRIDDLGDAEHLWSPVEGRTVHRSGDDWVIDIGDPDEDPATFTSIAWRMWHIAVDCLDSYSLRSFGIQSGPDDDRWYGTATEALQRTEAAWGCFRGAWDELDDAGWCAPLGEQFGPYAERPRATLALHAHAEVTHHAAEIGVLRDLYRVR